MVHEVTAVWQDMQAHMIQLFCVASRGSPGDVAIILTNDQADGHARVLQQVQPIVRIADVAKVTNISLFGVKGGPPFQKRKDFRAEGPFDIFG